MTSPHDLQNNRFEAMYQRWLERRAASGKRRGSMWRWVAILFCLFLVGEVGALAVIFSWYAKQGVLGQTYYDKFLLTRTLYAPWFFQHPAKDIPKVTYFGTATNYCTSARWLQPDGLLGWRLRPATSYLKQPTAVFDQVGWRMVNPQGFPAAGSLDFTVEKQKPKGVFRILFLGASSVEGDGAESPLQNLPSQFVAAIARLQAAPPAGYERIEVINAGVGGYRIGQEFLYLYSELIDYQPDMVLSYSGYVDFIYARMALLQGGRDMNRLRVARHELNGFQLNAGLSPGGAFAQFSGVVAREVGCLFDNLGMVFLAEKMLERVMPSVFAEGSAVKISTDGPELNARAVAAGRDAYENGLRLIGSVTTARQVKLAVAMQPALGIGTKPLTPVEKETLASLSRFDIAYRQDYQNSSWAVLQRMQEQKLADCALDMSQPFDDTTERVWEDGRHLLGAGNRIVAEKLVIGLRQCGLLN